MSSSFFSFTSKSKSFPSSLELSAVAAEVSTGSGLGVSSARLSEVVSFSDGPSKKSSMIASRFSSSGSSSIIGELSGIILPSSISSILTLESLKKLLSLETIF